MSKFCTKCGATLNGVTKFCTKCGLNVESAYQRASEIYLPLELVPEIGKIEKESLLKLLKNGVTSIASSFKRTLSDKKRLGLVIILAIIWLIVNFLYAMGISSLAVRILSYLSAAQGSLIGGSIVKGMLVALLAQVITDKDIFKRLKEGISQINAAIKTGKTVYASILMGAGFSLIFCNLLASSNLSNVMLSISGFAISAKALTRNGFLRGLFSFILPKGSQNKIPNIMQGCALGFVLFLIVSLIPGSNNGYFGGTVVLILSIILMLKNKKIKEDI